jgi:hypothetical protein
MTIVLRCDDRHTGCPGTHGMAELLGIKGHNYLLHKNHHNGEAFQSQDYELNMDKLLTLVKKPAKILFKNYLSSYRQPLQGCCN